MKEHAIYDVYMYPGPEPRVPVNLLKLRTWDELNRFEPQIVAVRAKRIPKAATQLTYEGMKALHYHLFQDIYEWAGRERTYTTGRNVEAPFAKPDFIASHVEKQFDILRKKNYFRDLNKDEFASKAANFFNEVNAAHPFLEGNGRVQRLFLQMIAENAGYELDLRAEDGDEWNEAARIGFMAVNTTPLTNLLKKRLTAK